MKFLYNEHPHNFLFLKGNNPTMLHIFLILMRFELFKKTKYVCILKGTQIFIEVHSKFIENTYIYVCKNLSNLVTYTY